ncbi:hypothetical protein CTA1_9384 [Colletotrichum tanaceti]|uniref:Uncharacterized protein n=1 Tax=Colletotrichum tanaceti TaxID=1306861 RepID=A0A4V6DFY7_9PEZI|nr:hypothetical protein CTA1_9384 [Colletotrichum tanaceti]
MSLGKPTTDNAHKQSGRDMRFGNSCTTALLAKPITDLRQCRQHVDSRYPGFLCTMPIVSDVVGGASEHGHQQPTNPTC